MSGSALQTSLVWWNTTATAESTSFGAGPPCRTAVHMVGAADGVRPVANATAHPCLAERGHHAGRVGGA